MFFNYHFSHGGQCNDDKYFWNLGCDHGFSYLVMAATMRDQCQLSRRCDSYSSYQRGYCDHNPSANAGWRFDNYDLVKKVLYYSLTHFNTMFRNHHGHITTSGVLSIKLETFVQQERLMKNQAKVP